ncbi:hypothetical protein Acsp06_60300 [Actinomycetospora sp. NBRC 106375]|uniref:DUF2231 domain-containing protein n=1 Tax=Actinomycetospora sp. NBRC 106375 TaxID=3032207 RepID=UPI0024A52F64|nr:DUF2231 domain-containing protein [Actinomycetospora sp. NBRC 106375]GLZ49845.1 hypothetical protein Acsp06_60300 [Actinomycetospora sp. NBRC 106375]
MTTVNGLPAHVLLVHAVVVLVPLTSLVIVLVAFWPAARRRLAIPAAVLSVVTLVAVPLTTEAGEWLEHRLPESELLRAHTELGDGLLPWAIGLALVGIAVGAREVLANRTARAGEDVPGPRSHARTGERGGRVVSLVLAVLAVVVAVGATVTTYEIGDSGSRAAWTGQFSPTPLQQPGPPRPDDDG